MSSPQQQGIARVVSADAAVCGTGFLISPRHLMTSAHVVNAASNLAWDSKEQPGALLRVEFPFASNGMATTASVIEWHPPGEKAASDIAVLLLEQEISLTCYTTSSTPPEPGQGFWTKGFPVGQTGGMETSGKLGTRIEYGRMLAHGHPDGGFFIEGGFSGAPLLDPQTNAVLAMAVKSTRDSSRRTAFVIPSDQLELAWPPLARPYKGLSAFQEADARYFVGRERYVTDLADHLNRFPLVPILGRSGVGKSSLVRAGLIPRLRCQGKWRIVTFRPGSPTNNPLRNFAAALLAEMSGVPNDLGEALDRQSEADKLSERLYKDPTEIISWLRIISETGNRPDAFRVLIFVDQFEDLFTAVPALPPDMEVVSTMRLQFVRCLCTAVSEDKGPPAAQCVLTLRLDYLGRALEIRDLADVLSVGSESS